MAEISQRERENTQQRLAAADGDAVPVHTTTTILIGIEMEKVPEERDATAGGIGIIECRYIFISILSTPPISDCP